ncbi:hypothetical protein LIER_30811 [Lithospermum erythrorhizon]|uniref:Pectinesterase inhibitor domain-containing protein n=1 Tax=Lithospermum erythrorhizon TaxID=34254 RepID=A0AAV3RSY2_LITER
MKIMSTFFFLLSLFICLTLQPRLISSKAVYISETALNNPELVKQACDQAGDKNFCINLLSSDKADGPKRNLKDIAFIALKIVEKNATETAMYIKTISNDDKIEPVVHEALHDCKGNYINVDDLIEDAIDELVSETYTEVVKFAKAALDDIIACDSEVKDQHQEAAAKNAAVRQMLETAISVVNVAAAGVAAH